MADDLHGFTFEVEDGTAVVTGTCSWRDRQYVACVVTRPDGSSYSTVRLAGLVRQRKGTS